MNTVAGSFGYAQARLQARLGQRVPPEDLQRARAARDLPAYLQQVRTTSLARRVARIAPGMDVHEVERRLRDEWGVTVEEVSRWLPARWRVATLWLRWLPYLPALQKLARGGRAAAWTREDPVLARIIAVEPGRRAGVLGGTALQPLQSAVADHGEVTQAWLTHWRSLWPDEPAAVAALERLVRRVATVAEALRLAAPQASSEDALRTLARRLLHAFRRHPLSPVAAYAFLGLEALDQLELRGAITMRTALAVTA
ncbi:MAG TPA: hypothetical protein VFI92_02745 [Steroidobacteraceae bacterium]|nr:hypothetical protein [Steroidobacteraceae bacterium]